jgi:CRISPR/Cas system-associated exonuclease Cas4 (RecB family)
MNYDVIDKNLDQIELNNIEDLILHIKEDLHERIHLSASSLKQYLACPRSFLFNKILKPKPTHPSYHWGWFGTMVHNSIYYSFSDFEDGEWVPNNKIIRSFEDVKEFYDKYFQGKFEDHEVLKKINEFELIDQEEFVFFRSTKSEINEIYETGLSLIESGIRFVNKLFSKNIHSIQVEKEIFFKPSKFRILGYIDIKFEYNGNIYFVDFKTSRAPLKGQDLLEDLQFYLYNKYLREKYNTNKVQGFLVHLRSNTAYRHKINDEIEEKNLRKIQMIEEEILKKNFPQNFGPLCRYCEFRGYCNIK